MRSYYNISQLFWRHLRRRLYLLLFLFVLCCTFLGRTPRQGDEEWNELIQSEPKLSLYAPNRLTAWVSGATRQWRSFFQMSSDDQYAAVFERVSDKMIRRITLSKEYGRNATERWSQVDSQNLVVAHDSYEGRLGNFMFETASLLGIAATNKRAPVMTRHDERQEFFENLRIPVVRLSKVSTADVHEDGTSVYTARTARLNAEFGEKPVVLHGYHQSWKYFANISDDIRQALTLDAKVQIKALDIIMRAVSTVYDSPIISNSKITLVGVHVRRSDYLHRKWLEKGSTPVPQSYFLDAVNRYRKNHTHPVFLILGDDVEYCQQTFTEDDFYVVTEGLARVHLAVLTLMDSLIISIGSFGWWGAYLSESKEITYFKNWPVKNTDLGRAVRHEDYYLPGWQGAL